APVPRTPSSKQLGRGVRLVTLDVARPTWPVDASGLCGRDQLARLRVVLAEGLLAGEFMIVALHYGLSAPSRGPASWLCRLRDARSLTELLDAQDVRVDLILHGHRHQAYRAGTKRHPVVCSGSATDLRSAPGYNIYTIDPRRSCLSVERRVWSPECDTYVNATSERLDGGRRPTDS
ncbi:MAG TPA: metallophosphoesterase, partial [Vicinamibacteria bacterium]|nr:metallophosphoesterase [Vicinamibacteria bacterium]